MSTGNAYPHKRSPPLSRPGDLRRTKTGAAFWTLVAGALIAGDTLLSPVRVRGFRYLADRHPDGKPKVIVTANEMTSTGRSGEAIDVRDVEVEVLDKDGRIEMRAVSPACRYSQSRHYVCSQEAFTLHKGPVTVSGRGFQWDVTQRIVRVLGDVRVTVVGATLFSPAVPGAARPESKSHP